MSLSVQSTRVLCSVATGVVGAAWLIFELYSFEKNIQCRTWSSREDEFVVIFFHHHIWVKLRFQHISFWLAVSL